MRLKGVSEGAWVCSRALGIITMPTRVCARDCGWASREYQGAPRVYWRECGHHGRRRSVVVHGQSECVECSETDVFAPGPWRRSRHGLRVKGRVNMKAQVNRRAVLRSLRFWVGGFILRVKGSGSQVRAHPSVAAAVTAGLRRRRQSVLFHPFNLLELACSPICKEWYTGMRQGGRGSDGSVGV